jgi:hypothetical protein
MLLVSRILSILFTVVYLTMLLVSRILSTNGIKIDEQWLEKDAEVVVDLLRNDRQ